MTTEINYLEVKLEVGEAQPPVVQALIPFVQRVQVVV
jgi:hypothetical protein